MKKRYPRTLSSGANNTVVAISETEVGKIFSGDTRSDMGSEAQKLKFANAINQLVVKFIRLDELNQEAEILVMERVYPMDFRAYEQEMRILWINTFERELQELHKAGFAHMDLVDTSDEDELFFDNIFLTQNGLRLIDLGISAMKGQVRERALQVFIEKDLEDFELFKNYFLSR